MTTGHILRPKTQSINNELQQETAKGKLDSLLFIVMKLKLIVKACCWIAVSLEGVSCCVCPLLAVEDLMNIQIKA